MATPQPRPVNNSFSKEGMVSAFSCLAEYRSHLRTATSSSVCRPLTRAKSLPSSSVSLPRLAPTRHHVTELSLGVDARRSAFRSLSSNPKLAVNVANGSVKILRRENTPFLPRTLKSSPGVDTSEREVSVSREGYHARSTSPTYQTLLLAKAQMEVLLARKLREVGDCVRCQQYDMQDQVDGPETLPSSCLERHPRSDSDFEDYVSEKDTKRLIDGGYQSSLPKRPIRFGSAVLRENKDNTTILELNEREVADRLREWKNRNSTNLPILERLDPEVGFTRPCHKNRQAGADGKERFMFLKRTSRQVITAPFRRKPKSSQKKRGNKENIVASGKGTDTAEREKAPIVEANLPSEKKIDLPVAVRADSSEGKIVKEEYAPQTSRLTERDVDRTRGLSNRKSSQSEKPIVSSVDPSPVSDCPEEEGEVKPLTAKEKFIRMQGRMADIQRKKEEKMSSFADYSYLLLNKKKSQSHMKRLGVNLSKRLVNMTVFQSKEEGLSDEDEELLLDISDISDSDDDDN